MINIAPTLTQYFRSAFGLPVHKHNLSFNSLDTIRVKHS